MKDAVIRLIEKRDCGRKRVLCKAYDIESDGCAESA